jgi:hypothetical protein
MEGLPMAEELATGLSQRGAPPRNDGSSLSSDLIWGVAAIAAEIGKTKRQTFHLIENRQIPAGKVGGRIVASRAKLRAHFEALLGEGV